MIIKRRRKARFKKDDWKSDFEGTLSRWLARYLPRILSRLWRNYPPRRAAKDQAEREGCQICGVHVSREQLEVDHIVPKGAVPTGPRGWDKYLRRYFSPPENLQGICKECHKNKTAEDRKKGFK